MHIVKLGERTYEFVNAKDISQAREIYAKCTGDQNSFELELENADIEFFYDLDSSDTSFGNLEKESQ